MFIFQHSPRSGFYKSCCNPTAMRAASLAIRTRYAEAAEVSTSTRWPGEQRQNTHLPTSVQNQERARWSAERNVSSKYGCLHVPADVGKTEGAQRFKNAARCRKDSRERFRSKSEKDEKSTDATKNRPLLKQRVSQRVRVGVSRKKDVETSDAPSHRSLRSHYKKAAAQ